MTERYTGQTVLAFLEYANEATAKIREINRLVCGMEMPEDESLLGAIYNNVYFMVEILLASIVKMDIGEDELNNMAIMIMHGKKDKIGEIIKGYGDTPI